MAYLKASERHGQLVRAAREVLCRNGVGGTTLRAVAAEAGIPLGTLHYVFPAKADLLQAVIDDTTAEVTAVLAAVDATQGLEHAVRQGLEDYWSQLVVDAPAAAMMRHELFLHAVRTPGLEHLARRQIDDYTAAVADWCTRAGAASGRAVADGHVDELADAVIATVVGLTLSFLAHRDVERGRRDLDAAVTRLVGRR